MIAVAVALVRAWTVVYTWGLPPVDRERRRAEVESDLWESCRDRTARSPLALHLLARLLLGVPDDMRWRAEQPVIEGSLRQTIAVTVVTAVLLTFVWIGVSAGQVDSPRPPSPPDLDWRHVSPPPPPPPPPPCNPPGIGRPSFSPCTPYR
jgi:hypothetical protein